MDEESYDLLLTSRQEQVLGRWIDGEHEVDIAADLGVTRRAVQYLIERAMTHNGFDRRHELAYFYGQKHGRERR